MKNVEEPKYNITHCANGNGRKYKISDKLVDTDATSISKMGISDTESQPNDKN